MEERVWSWRWREAQELLKEACGTKSRRGTGDIETARAALSAGASPTAPSSFGIGEITPFQAACFRGHLGLAQWLATLPGVEVGGSNFYGDTAFTFACEGGRLDVAQWLASRFEFDVGAKCADGWTVFILACAKGHLELAQWLATLPGIDVEATDVIEWSALHHACAWGRLPVAQWLIRSGLAFRGARDRLQVVREALIAALTSHQHSLVFWLTKVREREEMRRTVLATWGACRSPGAPRDVLRAAPRAALAEVIRLLGT